MRSFGEEYRRLNAAQRQAVDTIEGPVLVIAGPGTGKTQLLSLRVANILRNTDVNPGNILCLTYTESGQQAMRERLTQLLGRQAKKIEIHTFHGFGTYIINRYSAHFPELANFRPADDLALYEVARTCFEKLPRHNPLSKMAYGQFAFQVDAMSRISQLKQAGISPEQAKARAETDARWCQSTGKRIVKVFDELGRLSPKLIPSFQDKLTGILLAENIQPGLAQSCQDALRSSLNEAVASGKTASLSSFKKTWMTSEDGKLYFRPADQIKKLNALTELYTVYEAELRRRKLYDYDDMLLYALSKLSEDAELLAEVQETFQYILADEYQDTNAAQAQLITLIASNRVNEERPNVMVVGDDDQAIFGFQGALGDVLLHFREKWRDVTTITLKHNYRSTQAILDAARQVIQTGQNRLENFYEDIDKELAAGRTTESVEPIVFLATSPQAVLHKALATAKQAGEEQLAIIATKHRYLKELAVLLDAAHVNYFYEGQEDLLNDPELTRVLLLADLGLAIKRREYARTSYILPELITHGVVELSRQDAWAIAVAARQQNTSWWEVMGQSGKETVLAAYTALESLAGNLTQADALKSLITIAKQFGIHRQRFIKVLLSHARTYLNRELISLTDLLQYTVLCKQAGISLSARIEKGSPGASVVLLSAHKSKGLEFDRVYLLHSDYYTWFKEKGRQNTISLPPGWDVIEPPRQTTDDRLRLLYVAMTRARRELGFIRSRAARSGSQTENIIGLENLKNVEYQAMQTDTYTLATEQSWQAWYLPQTPAEKNELKILLESILRQYHLSPSHLTVFLDVVHGGPAHFLVHRLLGVPEVAHPEALFGSSVHQALRYAQQHLNDTGKFPTETQLVSAVRKSSIVLNEEQVTDVVEVVHEFLEHTSVLKPNGVSEYSFLQHNIVYEGLRLTGTVDHFVKDHTKLAITDFKTGRALNSWHVTEDYYRQKLHRFRQQLLFYGLLFSLSDAFTNVTTTELKIAFVEPSQRDVYYELVLDQDRKELARLQDLMKTVWNAIMEMNFPNTTSYSPDYSGIQSFEDDLLNGAI